MLIAEEVHWLKLPLIVDERRRHPLFQLATLADVIAAAQRNLGAFEPQPLTLVLFHAVLCSSYPKLCTYAREQQIRHTVGLPTIPYDHWPSLTYTLGL